MKALNIIRSIFVWLMVALAVFMMIFTIVSVSTFDRADRNLFGYKAFIVLSDSMSKTDFNAGDLVLVKEVDPSTLKEGDIIALENGRLTITEKSTVKALVKLAKDMVSRDTSFITLIYGEDVSEEEAEKAYGELREKFGSRTDITLVKGDQPVYYFILSVE